MFRPSLALPLVALALVVLMAPVAADAQRNPTLALSVIANRTNVAEGASLLIGVGVDNPGLPGTTVDFYFGALLPDGDTIVFFKDFAFNSGTGSLSRPSTLSPIAARIDLTTPFTLSQSAFFTYTWTGNEAPGGYTLFLAAVRAGALADNSLDAGDIVALSTVPLTFTGHGPAVVEARIERIDQRLQFGGTTTEQILNLFFQVPTGTVASVTVSGGPFSKTNVPFSSHLIIDGTTFDLFNIRQAANPFPNINQIFTFEAIPMGGGASQFYQTAFKNIPTSEAIEITNLRNIGPDPFALAAANLGSPLPVQWTLPRFTIQEVSLTGVVFNAQTTFCHAPEPILAPNATSGSTTLPQTCGGLPVVKTNVCVFVTGIYGEETDACHFHQDP